MKKSIKISKYFLTNITIILFSIVFLSCYTIKNIIEDFENMLFIIAWAINIVFFINICCIYKIKKNILDFNIVFILFLFLFCNGQVFLYSIGIPKEQLIVLKVCSNDEIIRAILYFYFSFLFYQIGASFFINKKENEEATENDEIFLKSIRIVAVLLMGLSVIPYFGILLPKIKTSLLYGYSALYSETAATNNGIIAYISKLFIPSLFMLCYSYKSKIKLYKILTYIIEGIAFLNILVGGRGEALSIVVTLIIFYSTFIKKIKGKAVLKLIPIILVIMIIIPVVSSIRSVKNKDMDMVVEEIINKITNVEENFFVETVSELGYTMHSFVLTEQVVPSVINHKYGESYLASFMMLIPSQFMGGYSFASKAALDIWLQSIHNMSYGPGYSMIAETYYNFGYFWGVIFTAVIGAFFSIFLNMSNKEIKKKELLKLLSFIFLYNSLIVVRFPFHNTIRNVMFIYVFPYILVNTIYATIKKGEKIID